MYAFSADGWLGLKPNRNIYDTLISHVFYENPT